MSECEELDVEGVDAFVAELLRNLDEHEDPETAHIKADDLLLGLLDRHGYCKTVNVFRGMTKWYA